MFYKAQFNFYCNANIQVIVVYDISHSILPHQGAHEIFVITASPLLELWLKLLVILYTKWSFTLDLELNENRQNLPVLSGGITKDAQSGYSLNSSNSNSIFIHIICRWTLKARKYIFSSKSLTQSWAMIYRDFFAKFRGTATEQND